MRMPKVQDSHHQVMVRMWSNKNSPSWLVRMQSGTAILEDSLMVLYKTKHILTIRTPWYSPKGAGNLCPYRNLHMMFTEALFIAVKTWKQPRCLSIHKWENKWWYIQTMEYYSVLKTNERLCQWRNLRCIILKVNLKRLHTVWLKLYHTWKRQWYGNSEEQWLSGLEGWINRA